MKLLALTAATLLTTLALACTADAPATPSPSPTPTPEATATPSPTASPAPAPPTRTPTPSPTPVDRTRSLEAVDRVIAAVEVGDAKALETLIRRTSVACGGTSATPVPPYPACDGEPVGTSVTSFPAGVCEAVWHRDPAPILQRFIERAGPLFAVIEGPAESVDYGVPDNLQRSAGDLHVIFTAEPAGEPVAYIAVIDGSALISLQLGCFSPGRALLPWVNPLPVVVEQGPAFVTPPPVSERTPLPSPNLAPRGTRTGLSEIDSVLAAVESGDPSTIRSVLHATPMQCTYAVGIGGPPDCEDGQQEATVVDAFLYTQCEGGWFRADLEAVAEDVSAWTLPLFAVTGPSGTRDWHQLLYSDGSTDILHGSVLYVENGAIIGRGGSCGPPNGWTTGHHIILRGPAWPEDSP